MGPKKILGLKIYGPKEFWSKNILVYKNYDPYKIGSIKLVQNQTTYSWDIADMDRCRQGICWLDKYHHDSWHPLNMVPRPHL